MSSVYDVISSIDSMKMSETIAMPRNMYVSIAPYSRAFQKREFRLNPFPISGLHDGFT